MPKYDSQYYSTYQQLRPKSYIMDRLTMLSQREQLMEDIQCMIESKFDSVFPHTESYQELRDEFIEDLCDVVCKNFPV